MILHGDRITLGMDVGQLPFSLRQPIQKGVGFFLYADKYAKLYQNIFVDQSDRYIYFRRVFDDLIIKNQKYIIEIFQLTSLMYVDQFGEESLDEFALRLEFLFGEIRLSHDRIAKETVQKFFSDLQGDELNLLDVITQASHPRQVNIYLKSQAKSCWETYRQDQTPVGSTVKGRYKKAILKFFGKETTSLAEKEEWVEDEIETLHAKR